MVKDNKIEDKNEINEKELKNVEGGMSSYFKAYCPHCKKRISRSDWKCPYCGKSVK